MIMLRVSLFLMLAAVALGGKLPLNASVYGGPNGGYDNALACMAQVKAAALPGWKANGFDIVGNGLRYAFHDCGTYPADGSSTGTSGGCDGAIRTTIAARIADGTFNTANNANGEDNGLDPAQQFLVGADGISGICGALKKPNTTCENMPFADCISFAGYLTVVATGGAPGNGCGWVPGRTDGLYPGGIKRTAGLPSEFSSAGDLHGVFGSYSLDAEIAKFNVGPLERYITLMSGAHTIGKSRKHGKDLCNKGINTLGATPTKFDNDYYQGIVANADQKKVDNNGGWFCSDQHGMCNAIAYQGSNILETGVASQPAQPLSQSDGHSRRKLMSDSVDLTKGFCSDTNSPLAQYYRHYAKSNDDFINDFCNAYQAMSLTGFSAPPEYDTQASRFALLLKA